MPFFTIGSNLSTSPNLAANRWYYCAITLDKIVNKATNNSFHSPATFFSLSKAVCYPGGTMIMLR